MYHFVTGFTSKLAGTERGITEPKPTFSTLFGEPFMPMDPAVYANMLGEKIAKYGTAVYLVNTGWAGGSAQELGKEGRMKLRYTRAMVTAALNGEQHVGQHCVPQEAGAAGNAAFCHNRP